MIDESYSNEHIDRLPKHLKQFVKPQNYELYTPIDQAVWRFVMRKNVSYLSRVAHESYLEGLKDTGISIDAIPNMYGMNRILKKIGWAAVAVDGFIPPAAFMEFQAYNVLVIASDIRQIGHIEYTPAPDIIHEGAGHAPIIANPEYSEYLRRFGEIGSKAISSAKDYELYEAVRELSILKEKEGVPEADIRAIEEKVDYLQTHMGEPSEMALIRNLHWWTVEYGLIGTLENPKIYGAGLLSSIGESQWCMTEKVKKLPYTIEATYQSFDITKPQPQLFVTPDFAHLSLILEEFANTMALRTGGISGLQKLINSNSLGTVELSTGLQVSGVFVEHIEHNGKVCYFRTQGGTALSYHNKELIGHSTAVHSEGFGTALGKLKGINLAIEDMSPRDLRAYNIYEGQAVRLEFEGNVVVEGEIITGTRNLQGKILLISFRNCRVTQGERLLFDPSWGQYDMAVGKKIVSAFSGPADTTSFDLITHELSPTGKKPEYSQKQLELHELYRSVRNIREGKNTTYGLEAVFELLQKEHKEDWLLATEIYELTYNRDSQFAREVYIYLQKIASADTKVSHLINDTLGQFKGEKV